MELCIQTGGLIEHFSFEEVYRMITEAGFTAIDWTIDHAWNIKEIKAGNISGGCIFDRPMDEIRAYYSEELSFIRKYGVKISQAHAVFPAYVESNPEVLDMAIRSYKNTILFCGEVGCKNLIIHGISLPLGKTENTQADIDRLDSRLYESLIPELKQTNVTVCLENLFTSSAKVYTEGHCMDPHEAAAFIDELNAKAGRDDAFGLCLDVGHLALLRRDPRKYISVLGKRIKALHVHDNTGVEDSHLAPLCGNINWNIVLKALHDAGYDGDLSFETFQQAFKAYDVDPDLVYPWLKLIAETGKVFRKRIIG